jgi:hypothetical protein
MTSRSSARTCIASASTLISWAAGLPSLPFLSPNYGLYVLIHPKFFLKFQRSSSWGVKILLYPPNSIRNQFRVYAFFFVLARNLSSFYLVLPIFKTWDLTKWRTVIISKRRKISLILYAFLVIVFVPPCVFNVYLVEILAYINSCWILFITSRICSLDFISYCKFFYLHIKFKL